MSDGEHVERTGRSMSADPVSQSASPDVVSALGEVEARLLQALQESTRLRLQGIEATIGGLRAAALAVDELEAAGIAAIRRAAREPRPATRPSRGLLQDIWSGIVEI